MSIVEVVKFNGDPNIIAWKYPSEELGTWTQLIVNESQVAILYKGGQALDVFLAGRHTLDTSNIPILKKLVNLPFGGRSPFTAEVWFINRVINLDIKWGTSTPIQLQDPKYKVFIPVRSFGQFGIQIQEPKKFLIKLVGTLPVFDKASILKYFRGVYLTKVKDSISSYLVNKQISVLEINAYLDELSEYLKQKMVPIMNDYGISLVNFYVNDINVPEDDAAVKKLKEALAKRAEMDIVGYSYHQERSFDTLEGAVTNPGSGITELMGTGIGLGLGAGIGGGIGAQMSALTQNIDTNPLQKFCPRCNTALQKEKRFCNDCGFDTLNLEGSEGRKVITCSNCGSNYSSGVKFCPECGDMYKPCPECKGDVGQDASVCPYCGCQIPFPCPICGTVIENEKAKFCPECGASLLKRCPACNTGIKGKPKFCPECGEKLQ